MGKTRSERGQALIETAISILLFLGVTLALVTFGHAFMVVNMITHAARDGARPSVAFLAATVCAAVLALASVPPLILFWAAARAAASAATWTSVAVSVRRLTSTAIPLMAMIATKRSAASTMAMPRSPSDCAAISSPLRHAPRGFSSVVRLRRGNRPLGSR